MDDKAKNNIDPEGSRERKSCQQLPPYHMPTTYVLMWKLLTSVLAEKVYVHILSRMCYRMSRTDEGKTHEE